MKASMRMGAVRSAPIRQVAAGAVSGGTAFPILITGSWCSASSTVYTSGRLVFPVFPVRLSTSGPCSWKRRPNGAVRSEGGWGG